MAGPPITEQEMDRIAALHADGLSRNAIARELGRSQAAVSRACDRMGLRFDRHLTVEATAAKVADAAARRAALQEQTLAGAERLMGQMFAQTRVYSFGGKENEYNERWHDEPPFRDKRDIATAVAALAQTALKLAEYDKAVGDEGDKSMLTDLRDKLAQAFGSRPAG